MCLWHPDADRWPRFPARGWGSVDRGKRRRCIELRKHPFPEAEPVDWREGHTKARVKRVRLCSGGVRDHRMCGHVSRGNRETSERRWHVVKHAVTPGGKASRRNPSDRAPEESDGVIVPGKLANNGRQLPGGVNGGKDADQEEPAKGCHEPDSRPGLRVEQTGAGAHKATCTPHTRGRSRMR